MNTSETIAPAEPSRIEIAIVESRKLRSGIEAECDRIEQLLRGLRDRKPENESGNESASENAS